MTTISVPLKKGQEEMLDNLIQSGVGDNRASVMRKALDRLAEEEAVRVVLEAQKEPTLRGDLRTLLRKFK